MKSCFFISPIGADKSEERKRNNQVLKYIIEPVCGRCAYAVIRADKIQEPGIITSQVVQQVLDSDLVIADLTSWNPNVFYELAIRHAFRKPYVQMIESNQRIPFDVAGVRTIQWDHHDLDSVEQCKADLEAAIRAIERDPKSIESPVSVAVDIQDMRRSGKPLEQSVADIRQSVEGLQQKFDAVLASIAALRTPAYPGLTVGNPYLYQTNVASGVTGLGGISFVNDGAFYAESKPAKISGVLMRAATKAGSSNAKAQGAASVEKSDKTEGEK